MFSPFSTDSLIDSIELNSQIKSGVDNWLLILIYHMFIESASFACEDQIKYNRVAVFRGSSQIGSLRTSWLIPKDGIHLNVIRNHGFRQILKMNLINEYMGSSDV